MDDLDFSGTPAKPAPPSPPAPARRPSPPRSRKRPSLYDPKLALAFFKIAGALEQFAAGSQIFVENEKASGFFAKGARMYLLLDGDVA
jgi:hypothetical protein